MGHTLRCGDVAHPITVIRDPVHRFLSMYRYWKNGSERYHRDDNCSSSVRTTTLQEFCNLVDARSDVLFTNFTWEHHFLPQSWWLPPECYSKTLVLVNHGSLHGCVNNLLSWIGIPSPGEHVGPVNVSSHGDCESRLDDDVWAWLHERYEQDFVLWDKLHSNHEVFGGVFFEDRALTSGGYNRPVAKIYKPQIMSDLPEILLFHPVDKRKAVCRPDNETLKKTVFGVDRMEGDLSEFRDVPVPEDFPWSLDTKVITEILGRYTGQEFVSVVEVGTHMGTTATRMASVLKDNPRSFVLCIDAWTSGTDDYLLRPDDVKVNLLTGNDCAFFKIFMANVVKQGLERTIIPFRMPSVHAGRILFFYGIQVDVVYVDASHEYIDVKHDLEIYYHIAKSGGVMFGDDYQIPGVKRAVDEFFGDLNLQVTYKKGVFLNNIQQIIWMVTKP